MQLISLVMYCFPTGINCEININECASQPCQFGGVCTDALNGFSCACPTTRAGLFCELESACINNPCRNGAICIEPTQPRVEPTCSCLDGFIGVLCGVNVDECASNPCQNDGKCASIYPAKTAPFVFSLHSQE